MRRTYTNGGRDYVCDIFDRKAHAATRALLAAPYFTDADRVLGLLSRGCSVSLIVGLNSATNPYKLAKLQGLAGLSIRFLTSRFHAKIFLFDEDVLLGSANLTDGGLTSNREAVIHLDRIRDEDAVEEVQALFHDLWDCAAVLTPEILAKFTASWKQVQLVVSSADAAIEKALGKVQPRNVAVESHRTSRQRLFLQGLQRKVYEQYRPAFSEVNDALVSNAFRRPELAGIGEANETNRFLNWLRLSRVHGDEAWREAPIRSKNMRAALLQEAGAAWKSAERSLVPADYVDWLERVNGIFGDDRALAAATKEDLTGGLMSLHAFAEQHRFTTGGIKQLPAEFWRRNGDDLDRVKRTLTFLIYGRGDFVERLHDVVYDQSYKLSLFGQFCALELFGTVRPDLCPPMNGRMAKALKYIGFDVPV